MDLDAANLIQCPLFRGLDLDELPGLLRRLHARTRRADRGEVVLRAGEVPGELGVVSNRRIVFSSSRKKYLIFIHK